MTSPEFTAWLAELDRCLESAPWHELDDGETCAQCPTPEACASIDQCVRVL